MTSSPSSSASSAPLPDPQRARLREATIRALLLGAVLSIVMGAANAYLGLYAGMTVSASIPAAVISMAILRGLFRSGTVQENNIVQSITSAGESLAAGVIFTIPALLLVGAWHEFAFWPTTLIAFFGGLLGIVFMIPLRRAFIVERPDLAYPEGVACAEVLQAGEGGGSAVRAIFFGAGLGALLKLLAAWTGWIRGTLEGAAAIGNRVVYGGLDLSPALVGVGYIVQLRIAVLIFFGGAIAWLGFLPASGIYTTGAAETSTPQQFAWDFWNANIRYVGVGAMLIGAVQSLFQVRSGVFSSIRTLRYSDPSAPQTARDMPFWQLIALFFVAFGGTVFVYKSLAGDFVSALILTCLMIAAAWIFVALAAYIVGFVGSSNSPVSGLTITALLLTSGAVLGLGLAGDSAALAILGVAGLVCCATCTAGDIAQDLKTGQIVGATPWKQQWAEILGIAAAAPIFAGLLTLLNESYGIGTGEPGALKAPQAALFAGITDALVGAGELPMNMLFAGMAVGAIFLALDLVQRARGAEFRFHVMPIAVGVYLPLSLSVAILLGGLLRYAADRRRGKTSAAEGGPGVLFASGLIAGESLAGIFVAVLITNALVFPLEAPGPLWTALLGAILFAVVLFTFFRFATRRN